jgi:hypothetical protein
LFSAGAPQRWMGFDVAAILAEISAGEQPLSVVLNWKQ